MRDPFHKPWKLSVERKDRNGDPIKMIVDVVSSKGYYIISVNGYYSGRALSLTSVHNILKILGIDPCSHGGQHKCFP